jgi:exopolysaccharide biosynthesis protein
MENSGARIILNGGYFLMDHQPAQHVGLLKTNGNLEEAASPSVIRDQSRYFINRGAFGIKNDGTVDIAWCSTKNDSIFEWDAPLQNRPGLPQDSLHFQTAKFWDVKDAFHAGPVLINDGKINVTVEQEAFFNTPIAGVQPRSAIGYTKDNVLILMVVDGRQVDSRGVYLEELALLMNQFNCIEALNLDGGGSSAMVADSRLLNRPGGLTLQREIMSVIGIFYNNYIE